MAEAFVLSFVEKLMSLEKKTGSSVHYRIMPPILAPFHDCISIQKVARQIADSIGLSQFTFIIAFAKQKQNVGGHIDLRTDGAEVFIEIDPDAVAFPDSVGATRELVHGGITCSTKRGRLAPGLLLRRSHRNQHI